MINDFKLVDGVWKWNTHNLYGEDMETLIEEVWETVPITDVPVKVLLDQYESMVLELSDKEVELLTLKEYIQSESFHIETTFDFKEAYGKNNADIRKQHIKSELADVFDKVQSLELSINWIKSYIPLVKEVIRVKQ